MQDPSRPATGYPYPNPAQAPATANGYPPPQPGTAYPYQNPYYAPPQQNPRTVFYRRLIVIFCSIILTFGLILFIFFLIMRPRLPEFRLTSLSVANFDVTNNQVSGNWNLQFQVTNPNKKMSLYYRNIVCSVSYNGVILADTRLQLFDQGTRDKRTINASLAVTGTYVDGRVLEEMNKEKARGSLEFDVKLFSIVGYRYGAYRGRRRYVKASCGDVAVGLSSNSGSGKMNGPGKECRVY